MATAIPTTDKTLSSTRFRLVIVGVLVAVLKEIATQNGVIVSQETFLLVEGLILSLAGLDTFRPLGHGKGGDGGDGADPVVSDDATEE